MGGTLPHDTFNETNTLPIILYCSHSKRKHESADAGQHRECKAVNIQAGSKHAYHTATVYSL
jgi:hypothetical protein